jgi:hypothetical protein
MIANGPHGSHLFITILEPPDRHSQPLLCQDSRNLALTQHLSRFIISNQYAVFGCSNLDRVDGKLMIITYL